MVSSGGVFPVSVAVHGNLVYVLNAENGGSIQGYVAFFGRLFPLPGRTGPWACPSRRTTTNTSVRCSYGLSSPSFS